VVKKIRQVIMELSQSIKRKEVIRTTSLKIDNLGTIIRGHLSSGVRVVVLNTIDLMAKEGQVVVHLKVTNKEKEVTIKEAVEILEEEGTEALVLEKTEAMTRIQMRGKLSLSSDLITIGILMMEARGGAFS